MTTKPQRAAYKLVYHDRLGRKALTTGVGTVRMGSLVRPETLAGIEEGTRSAALTRGQGIDQLWGFAQMRGFRFTSPSEISREQSHNNNAQE